MFVSYLFVGSEGLKVNQNKISIVCILSCNTTITSVCFDIMQTVSNITSSEMERRISTASRQAEAKNDKEMGIIIIILLL